MKEIITFRPSAEANDILNRVKDEGGNISRYLNGLIVAGAKSGGEEYHTHHIFYPDKFKELYMEPSKSVDELISTHTVPIGVLPARVYHEFRKLLSMEGMEYHFFKLDADHTVGFIAANRELASEQFAKCYVFDKDTKEYMRTSVPLPIVRYNPYDKIAVVIVREPNKIV